MVQQLAVPHLTSDGLLLRPWKLDDLPLVREASEDDYIPLITTIPPTCSDEAGTAFVHRQWDRATTGTGYPFVITRRADEQPLGSIGLWVNDLPEGRASLGYWLVKSARGQGVAASALRMVVRWAIDDLRIPRLQLNVEPWNTASIRTAERVGFRREGLLGSWQQVGPKRQDMLMYSLLREDPLHATSAETRGIGFH